MSNFSKFVKVTYNGKSVEQRLGFRVIVIDPHCNMSKFIVRFSYMAKFAKDILRKYGDTCTVHICEVSNFAFPEDELFFELLPF